MASPEPQPAPASPAGVKPRDWREFWNADTPIYANRRHLECHYRHIAADIVRLIEEFHPDERPDVLDYGCGEALSAGIVARRCTQLTLLESAVTVAAALRARHASDANVRVLLERDMASIAPRSLDLIVANSVVQYLTAVELRALLHRWHGQLRPGGRLVVADIIPHATGALTDAWALLRFAARDGFLGAAVLGLVRTTFSDYRKLRGRFGLAHYDAAELDALLREAGFADIAAHANLGHNPARLCRVARAASG
jgi:SAM-dependent methyltransferase